MPTYQYACTDCGHRFEAVQAFTDDSLTTCPECGGKLRKVYGSVGVVFKGSGFYRTDSRAASSDVSPAKSSDKSGPEKSGSSEKSGTRRNRTRQPPSRPAVVPVRARRTDRPAGTRPGPPVPPEARAARRPRLTDRNPRPLNSRALLRPALRPPCSPIAILGWVSKPLSRRAQIARRLCLTAILVVAALVAASCTGTSPTTGPTSATGSTAQAAATSSPGTVGSAAEHLDRTPLTTPHRGVDPRPAPGQHHRDRPAGSLGSGLPAGRHSGRHRAGRREGAGDQPGRGCLRARHHHRCRTQRRGRFARCRGVAGLRTGPPACTSTTARTTRTASRP